MHVAERGDVDVVQGSRWWHTKSAQILVLIVTERASMMSRDEACAREGRLDIADLLECRGRLERDESATRLQRFPKKRKRVLGYTTRVFVS